MSIKLIVVMRCEKEADDAFLQELQKLVTASVNDEGCISYELYDYEEQEGQYIIIQEWESEEALNKHQETPHYRHFTRIAPVLQCQPAKVKKLKRLI